MLRFLLPVLFALALGAPAAAAQPDIVESLRRHGFKTFSEAVTRAGLVDTLKSPGPLTVFAPSESAFMAISDEERLLLMEDKGGLSNFVLRHVVNGAVSQDATALETMSGERLRLERSGDDMVINGVRVTGPAVTASNGVVHRLDTLFPPPIPAIQ